MLRIIFEIQKIITPIESKIKGAYSYKVTIIEIIDYHKK